MKLRLIWKILAGFTITSFVIIQLVWAVFYLLWGDTTSHTRSVAESVAPIHLSAARLALETGGLERYREVVRNWPESEWNRLSVVEDGPATPRSHDADVLWTQAVDPQGASWQVSYRLPGKKPDWHWRYFFQIPLDWAIPSMLGGLLFSAALAWYLTRPMLSLREGFHDLANGRLDTRLQPVMGRRRDEIADLAKDFDRMAEQLQHLVRARDQLLHDVSHEFRSPLARISLAVALVRQAGGVPRESLRRIESEVARLDQLVGELLSLSRYESGVADIDAYFDLKVLLETLVVDARFEARSQGIDIQLRIDDPQRQVLLQGSAELIRRALENILRNALQFSPQGQAVEVHLTDGRLAGEHEAIVRIGDRGPGIPENQLEHVLEPFVRVPGGEFTEGYGLGLAIARRAIQSHHGTITVGNRAGGGLLVQIALPLARIDPKLMDPAS
ncbi:MAG: HAMP domain-containing histidine kinase [Burkholderiaceae bacterium]|jgi:two-component system OmpR family sensor kinase|nr:HAMP domain-containing histidine kinase [Burkholderiaceae bacterium]